MLPRDAEGYVTPGAKWALVGVAAAFSGAAATTAILWPRDGEARPHCEASYVYSEGICVLDPYAAQPVEGAPNYDAPLAEELTAEPTETPAEEPEATVEPTEEAPEDDKGQEQNHSASGRVELNPDTCRQWGDVNRQPFEYGAGGSISVVIDTRWRDGCKPDENDGATVYKRANTGSKRLGRLANGSVVKVVGLECAQTPTPIPKAPLTGNKMPSALWLTVEVDGKRGKVTGYDTGYPDQQTLRSSGFTQKYAVKGQGGNC